tara:strand:+ start:3797 stop:4081 length:285 start_codon:yes stop_codon:yes gene_type:complete
MKIFMKTIRFLISITLLVGVVNLFSLFTKDTATPFVPKAHADVPGGSGSVGGGGCQGGASSSCEGGSAGSTSATGPCSTTAGAASASGGAVCVS